ncbi:MAG: NAD(P)-dependent dehydrogenase (short-subunit alcohol dehydrogenase family) [Saprospiraceae bacterium]|jgi:3-oxoacyl-[acyl-carrier protein] reductase
MKGKTALITGGTKGIGYGIAEAMLNEEMNVVITGRNQATVDEAVNALAKIGKGQILGVASDVRDLASQESSVTQTVEKFGSLDVLIANAGVGHFASIENLTSEQWQQTIDINLTGVFNSIKAALEPLKTSKGYFISIASLAGTNFFAYGAAYNASKFGLVGFTQAVMLDLRKHGIKTTTIMPGSVATYFNNHVPNDADAWKIQPEDLGQMVIDLLKMNPRTLPSKIEVRPSQTA